MKAVTPNRFLAIFVNRRSLCKGGKLNMENSNYDQHKRIVDDRIACEFGVAEAFILEQLQYWIKVKSENPEKFKNCYKDGRWWVYNTYSEWQEQLCFYSEVTIRRAFKNLEKSGIILTANYNKKGYDKTKWYTVDFDVLDKILSQWQASDQNDQSIRSNRAEHEIETTKPIPITTTTITSKNSLNYRVAFEKSNDTVSENKIDMEIVYRQINSACDILEVDVEDRDSIKSIFKRFYSEYRKFTGKDHVKLSDKNIFKVVNNIVAHDYDLGYIDYDMYCDHIQDYFYGNNNFVEDCNYSIIHFSETLKIREYNFERNQYENEYLPF